MQGKNISGEVKKNKDKNLRLYSVKELSERTGLSIWTIYELVEKEKIPYLRLGKRKIYFREEKILEWLKSQEISPREIPQFYPAKSGT